MLPFAPPVRKQLWQNLPWLALTSHRGKRRIIQTIDGAWMMTIAIRGPDLVLRSTEDRFTYSCILNNVVRQLGTGYVIWADEFNVPWTHYQRHHGWNNPASELYDAEAEAGVQGQFVSNAWITVYYKPPSEAKQAVIRELIHTDPEEENDPYKQRLDAFVSQVEKIAASLSVWMPYVQILENGQLLTYLKSHISTKLHPVADMEHDEQLPGSLVDMPFHGYWRPKMGHAHDKWSVYPISVHNYVTSSIEAAVLSKLRSIDQAVRWRRVVRFICQDKHESIAELQTAWNKAAAARKPIATQFFEATTQERSMKINPAADEAIAEAMTAHMEMTRGYVSRGYLTQAIIIYVPRKPAIERAAKEFLRSLRRDKLKMSPLLEYGVTNALERLGLAEEFTMQPALEFERALNDEGLVTQIAGLNAAETIKGAIPGCAFHDVTRHGVNSAVATAFMPFDGVWSGTKTEPQFKRDCLMQVRTNGKMPFWLNVRPRAEGPANVISFGRSRSGKTALKNAAILNFMKYPNAQVFGIEMNHGSMVTTLCMGGSYHEIGGRHGKPLQPLRMIRENRWWRLRIFDWLLAHFESIDAEKAKDPILSKELTLALDRAAKTIPDDMRDMTAFVSGLNHMWGKDALRPLTKDGEYGYIFDGIDRQSYDNRNIHFDITEVEKSPILSHVSSYLFLLMLSRAHPERPMLFTGDEAVVMTRPPFSGILDTHFRRLASKNIQAWIATQQVTDVVMSPVATVITSNSPTRIFSPGPDMKRRGEGGLPGEWDALTALGLRPSEIEALAVAQGYQFMIQQEVQDARDGTGVRFFDLNLSEKQKVLTASTNSADIAAARVIVAAFGPEGFLDRWLARKGQGEQVHSFPLAAE